MVSFLTCRSFSSMFVSVSMVLLKWATCTIAHNGSSGHHHHHGQREGIQHGHEQCGTSERSAEQRAYSDKLAREWKNRKLLRQNQDPITFPICFHVIRPTNDDDPDFLDAASLQVQLDHLNLGFSSSSCCDTSQPWCQEGTCSIETGIRFEMALLSTNGTLLPGTTPQATDANACVTRTQNDAWYSASFMSDDEYIMKQELHQGDARVLNIWYNDLRGVYGQNETILGHARFPEEALLYTDIDGVVLANKAASERFKDTITHEVGHWLGLEHTFEQAIGVTCGAGDEIQDTPAEKVAAIGCDPQRDTCPSEGLDPVHNFMDYSSDDCTYEFTPDQLTRMMSQIEAYRLEFTRNPDIVLQDGVPSGPINLIPGEPQTYKLEISNASFVQCFVDSEPSEEAIYSLFMRIDQKPDLIFGDFDCDSGGFPHCAVSTYGNATIWIELSPFGDALQGIVFACIALDPTPTTPLTYGVASVPFSLETNETEMFELVVEPENTVIACELLCDNGDPDTFLRFNSQLYDVDGFFTVFDAAGATEASNELFVTQVPSETNAIFVAVSAYFGFEGAILTCYSSEPRPAIALVDEMKSDPISVGTKELQHFTLDVEKEAMGVQCKASTSSGDGVLVLDWGSEPDLLRIFLQGYTCLTGSFGTPCTAPYAGMGDYFLYVPVLSVLVYANEPLEDLEVICESIYPEVQDLKSGVASDPLDLMDRDDQMYRLDVTPGSNVTCQTGAGEGGTGEVDLYLRFNEPLLVTRRSRANCSSETTSSEEVCLVSIPNDTSLLYVTIKSFNGNVSAATVLCIENVTELPSSSAPESQWWFITSLWVFGALLVWGSF